MSLEAQLVLSLIAWAIVILGSLGVLTSPWGHFHIFRHRQIEQKVSIGVMDTSKGILVTCSCKKVWAK